MLYGFLCFSIVYWCTDKLFVALNHSHEHKALDLFLLKVIYTLSPMQREVIGLISKMAYLTECILSVYNLTVLVADDI